MPDQIRPGDVPPDLPPEYAEAYRRGYERAYRESGAEPAPASTDAPLLLDEQASVPAPAAPLDRPVWLVPVLLAALVVVLLVGAYGIGRVLADNLSDTRVTTETPDGVVLSEDGSTSPPESPTPKASKKPQAEKYAGQTNAAAIGGASGTCDAAPGVDSAGNQVSYAPSNVYDQDPTTAWRCDGDGAGQKLTVDLPDTTKIGEVGLIPGYAKTDARSGVDRYAENNRITEVRWVFDDGTSVEQSFDASPTNRAMQSMRIPVTRSSRVVVEILDAQSGPRNTIAVSELRIGEAAG